MNIHPLFVHFPIGLLVLYALMELVPTRFHSRFLWWSGAKTFLLAAGLVAAVPTLFTGEMAADAAGNAIDHAVLAKHELFASATVWIFAILGAAYLVRTFARYGWGDKMAQWLWGGPASRRFGALSRSCRDLPWTLQFAR